MTQERQGLTQPVETLEWRGQAPGNSGGTRPGRISNRQGTTEEGLATVQAGEMPRWQGVTAEGTGQARAINGHIARALLSLVSAALLLRAGGMLNQVIVSANFGAGAAMDAYFVATALPLLLVQLLTSALEAAVIPVYSRLRMHSGREGASRLLSTLINGLVLGTVLLVLILLALRQPLILLSAPGLDAGRLHQAVSLAPLLYLALPLSLVIGLLECVLNAEGQFGWPAYAGILVPLTTALLTLVGGNVWGIEALCTGSLVGTVLQMIVVGMRVRRARLRYRLVIDAGNPDLRAILTTVWPVLLGAFIIQGGPLVDQIFASTLPAGSISAFNYALKLVSIFIGVLFVSVGRAMLPYLARQAALGDPDYRAFKGTLRLYLWGVGLCTLLLSLFLLLLGRPLVALLFQRGAFSAADTLATATILAGFAPGLLPMAGSFLLSRAFNALGETRVPMYLALVNVGANALLDALFVRFWQGLGIALATSAVSLITSLLLLAFLYRRIGTLRVWHVPLEMHAVAARLKPPGWAQRAVSRKSWLEYDFSAGSRQESWLERCFSTSSKRQGLLSMGVMLVALVFGAFATARNAVGTLQVSAGGLLVLCFLRYPFVLLLAWASLDVGIGSSLVMLNGNHLDLVLLLPLLCLLPALPWREMSGRVPGLRWLALYLVWVLLGIGLSPLDVRAFLTLWLAMLASAGAGVLTIALVTTRRHLMSLINALLATALLVALYGLYGFVTHQQGEMDPDTSLFRVTSLFTQATTFAFYLSPLIPLAFYRYLYAQGAFRLAGLAVMLCLLGALLLTFTRSAYVSIFLGIVIMALCLPSRRGRLLLVSGWLCAGGAAFYLGWSGNLPLLARFFKTDTATFNGRLYLWQALLRNFQVTRWLGSGLQSSDQLLAYLHVGTAGQGVIGTAPHSLFLGTLYDHGIIGLLLLSFFLLSLGWRLLQGITGSSGERRMLYAAALASLVSVLVQSLGSRDLWIQAAGVPFWIVVALPFARYWPENAAPTSDESRQRDSRSRWGCSLLSGFLLFCRIHTYVKGEV